MCQSSSDYSFYDTILIFGDSITQYGNNPERGGYVTRLANLFQRHMDVINRGFATLNSSSALVLAKDVLPITQTLPSYEQVPSAFFKQRVHGNIDSMWPARDSIFPTRSKGTMQLFILFFGTNDAQVLSQKGSTPIDKYHANMHSIISLLQNPQSNYYSPNTRILVITPPPVGERMVQAKLLKANQPTPFLNRRTAKYAEVAKQVAREARVPYVDLFTEIQIRVEKEQAKEGSSSKYEGYENYLYDGVHLDYNGNTLLYDLICKAIRSNWPELFPQKLPP
ncbi:isoamyl acetate-hydrolyzing esterase [Coemansia brasiliensis]|uniref:Isoamyl acetate-hydrolyzing esterase n=1 Tax=Coemansia brasiliensis TaxID=2650707 RepID=A0A9W8LYE2_9FUNG|nr:isoamyl acetate-hydrolyzing esterase [Coemansia brasiliensis]